MSLIYEPRGKAREYSPWALNIYTGCVHGCKYCYAPKCLHKSEDDYFRKPSPREGIVEQLDRELTRKPHDGRQVLLSFIGDPYTRSTDDNAATREVLEVLLRHKVPVAILTKAGSSCLRDINLFKKFGKHIQVGATLTFHNKNLSAKWEPNAAKPFERIDILNELSKENIRTFASFEPVIIPSETLQLLKICASWKLLDIYKIGKLNNFQGLDKKIDWTDFLKKALEIVRPTGKGIYIKEDLRLACPSIELTAAEMNPDIHNVTW